MGLIVWICCVVVVGSQTRTFEVASIKRNTSGSIAGDGARRAGTEPGGRFVMVDGTALVLVRSAFPDAVEVIGAPAWASSEHYDVEAKANGVATSMEIEEMLRALLVERFKLVAHYEMREKPTYSLMLARDDGRLGSQLRRYDGDCAAFADDERKGRERPQMPTPSNGAAACGYTIGGGGVVAGGIDMSAVARAMQFYAGRKVIDKTGLPGYYEFTLQMSADVPVFTAIREQLGLKLEPDRASLPVVVVDHIEHPTEN
ncbi:MAG TPA: TIGR03435 family protein [Vicinamibacterales bacterium]|nr:TIGR03435 family protein [Vicinamibacterales bacterium]